MATLTPLEAMKYKCLDCMCGSANEVKKCEAQDCSLWEYRLGHHPSAAKNTQRTKDVKILGQPNSVPKRILSEEQLERLRERMHKMRQEQLLTKKKTDATVK